MQVKLLSKAESLETCGLFNFAYSPKKNAEPGKTDLQKDNNDNSTPLWTHVIMMFTTQCRAKWFAQATEEDPTEGHENDQGSGPSLLWGEIVGAVSV